MGAQARAAAEAKAASAALTGLDDTSSSTPATRNASITHIVDGSRFFVHFEESAEVVEQVTSAMASFDPSIPSRNPVSGDAGSDADALAILRDTFPRGTIAAALFDGQWYRASVKSIAKDKSG